ncbi:fimbrial chaperone protein [Vibrio azureus]|uniref:Putative fimbrial chaperone protein n=1 Tax=Vibrio azureus NBRC 104587 TaxID=1219077 RepID=U3CIQ4_9VIBR|nr:fimbrial chaperone [Vibrio azureus]AUI86227.1 fimbrial chaperone protein [Vibrio azureus]GAD78123.1 putative fimbrial chaperone protein [Vibrio azureus NBRC 104587]
MKKLIKLILFYICVFSPISMAAFVLNGTRVIFNDGNEDGTVTFVIKNKASDTYGGQVWIDNIDEKDNDVYFLPMPSFLKVDGGESQVVRIKKITDKLPKDRESIFWLNVQEIPPVNKNKKNALVIAVNTRIKLIYRPESLIDSRENAEEEITLTREKGALVLNNPTPYYFSIIGTIVGDKKIKLGESSKKKMSMLAPNSKVVLDEINASNFSKLVLEAINDYGAINKYEVKINESL